MSQYFLIDCVTGKATGITNSLQLVFRISLYGTQIGRSDGTVTMGNSFPQSEILAELALVWECIGH